MRQWNVNSELQMTRPPNSFRPNWAVNADAQVRPCAALTPILVRRLLLRYAA
jgi:hypothetical protein